MTSKTLIKNIQHWLHLKTNHIAGDLLEAEAKAEAPDEETTLAAPPELFNVDQMERHGRLLALSHTLASKNVPDILLRRLAASENTLRKAVRILSNPHAAGKTTGRRITPAGEWLLDNFYLIEAQIRTTRRHLPKNYGRSLPQLAGGFLKGYPRVYDIALQIIEHGDGRWDLESLQRALNAYQSVTPLTLGELWAIPIMLRLAMIENLSRVSARIVTDWNDHNLADRW